jgi:basic membrane protein A
VGAAAALIARSDAVGFVGGMDSAHIRKFEAGYRAGAGAVRPGIRVMAAYAGVTGEAFANPPKGKELALAQFDAGADVIFHAAGTTGFGVFKAAEERGRRAIGVDADQSSMAGPGVIVTSMTKNTGETVFRTIAQAARGEWQGGIQEFGLAEKAIGYVANEQNKDILNPAIVERIEELRGRIVNGQIKVPTDPGKGNSSADG